MMLNNIPSTLIQFIYKKQPEYNFNIFQLSLKDKIINFNNNN